MPPPVVSRTGLSAEDMADLLRHGDAWADDLRGARVLVTGASGWFGTWLLDALLALNDAHDLQLSVVGLCRNPQAFVRRFPGLAAGPALSWIAADVREPFVVDGGCTHVIHAATAASASLNAADPQHMFDVILEGTRQALRAAEAAGARRFLFVSSGAIYGRQPDDLAAMDETFTGGPDCLATDNAYAEGKRAAELLVALHHRRTGLHATVARCFAFVGPHMPLDAHFAIGNFLRDAISGGPIVIKGDGTPRRSYLYPSDLVTWLFQILVRGKAIRPYNVGGPEASTLATLAHACADAAFDLTGRRVSVEIQRRDTGGSSYVPLVARCREELGLEVDVSLGDALRRSLQWTRQRTPQTTIVTSA